MYICETSWRTINHVKKLSVYGVGMLLSFIDLWEEIISSTRNRTQESVTINTHIWNLNCIGLKNENDVDRRMFRQIYIRCRCLPVDAKWKKTFMTYLFSTSNRTRLPRSKPPMWGTRIHVTGPHNPLRLFVWIAHGFIHYGGGAVHNRRHRWDYGLLTQCFPMLDSTSTCGWTLRPVTQHPRVLELLGSFPFRCGKLVGDSGILDFSSEDHLEKTWIKTTFEVFEHNKLNISNK